jgi:hypothetical protein
MAGGQVRCGRCGELFNALERLSDDVAGYAYGESPLELESRADEILRSAEPATAAHAPPPAGAAEVAQLEFLGPVDDELSPDAALDLTLPPEELDRIFVETTPNLTQLLFPSVPPISPIPPPPAAPVGSEVSDDVRRAMLGSFRAKSPQIEVPRRLLPRSAWAAAAILLALLLAAQLMMANNAWLSAHVPLIDLRSDQEPKLSAYQLKQWGVAADPAAKGTLRVRASILNAAAQTQPYPLLRVRFADRFGARVAERIFEPSEYLGKLSAQMLAPGERIDAIMNIFDPGKEAEGFEIDVCLRGPLKKISCAADAAAPSP